MSDLISVIIPCYKVEKYLPKCIESVINQEYNNIEIIMIDDGSPDLCGKICEQYAGKDKRIRVIHQSNKGISGARNSGINVAKGKYLFFVDSDDYIYPNTIKMLYDVLVENNADIVSAENSQSEHQSGYPENLVVGNGDFVLDYILKKVAWSAWGKLYRREIIGNDRFIEGYIYEDFEFVLRQYLKTNKAVHICKDLYYYLKRSDSIMGSTKEMKEYYFDFADRNLDSIVRSQYSENSKEILCADIYRHVLWDYCRQLKEQLVSHKKTFMKRCSKFISFHFTDLLMNKELEYSYKMSYIVIKIWPCLFDFLYKTKYRIIKIIYQR